jgi:hypothetical protein
MPPDKEHEKSPMNTQPKKTATEDKALYIASVRIRRGKLIEELMSKQDLKDTGVGNLTAQQKAALNAFLDPALVVAPGPISH